MLWILTRLSTMSNITLHLSNGLAFQNTAIPFTYLETTWDNLVFVASITTYLTTSVTRFGRNFTPLDKNLNSLKPFLGFI